MNYGVYLHVSHILHQMLRRLMQDETRHNQLEYRPTRLNVFLLVTGDHVFNKVMMDLKEMGITVLLARPEDVEQADANFGEGFNAVWFVE
ncbi:unnamed protein product [Microthlaspi erraticum]|uniref:Uncharacterized protein n=1 Tax=Microthlaspi erraticum TaxID=1685480 RepID=A0A6D2KNB2_9BRAS|nr:unnamed protein product [Microthlaspi erraticum]